MESNQNKITFENTINFAGVGVVIIMSLGLILSIFSVNDRFYTQIIFLILPPIWFRTYFSIVKPFENNDATNKQVFAIVIFGIIGYLLYILVLAIMIIIDLFQ